MCEPNWRITLPTISASSLTTISATFPIWTGRGSRPGSENSTIRCSGASEVATLTFFRGVNDDIKKRIAKEVGQPDRVIMSWLLALNTVRNRCAHHSRLWNWDMGTPVQIPQERKFPEWHAPRLPNNRVGIILCICRYWLNQISPANRWSERVRGLFTEYPHLPLHLMGLVEDWQEHLLWKDKAE